MARMTAEQAAEHGKDLSFEKVWAMFEETDRRMAESRAEADRRLAKIECLMTESREEADRRVAEARAEVDRGMREADRRVAEARAEVDRKMREADRRLAEAQTEVDRKMREADRRLAEARAEADRRLKEVDYKMEKADRRLKEVDCKMEEADRRLMELGRLNCSVGELIEAFIAARFWEKFPQYGFVRHYRRLPVFDETNHIRTGINILLSCTDKAMAVEVNRQLDDTRSVDYHLERMELIRTYPPLEIMNKELFGAIASGVVDADTALYAYKAGFYVLELTVDTVSLIPPPDGFKPGVW